MGEREGEREGEKRAFSPVASQANRYAVLTL